MPAVWQVQRVKPTLFSIFLWDGCGNFSWLSYVTLAACSPDGKNVYYSNMVYFPGGGASLFTGATDYLTNTKLTGDMTNGYTLYYPDGSHDVYGFIVPALSVGWQPEAYRTQHWDAYSNAITFVYSTSGSSIQLTNVIDATGGTNWIYYGSTNVQFPNLITQVMDRYG
ncbi:MAG TPA: hypothetical protein VH280_25255, partial [Verrucomicrobiae bacterium]|nr:hypothetical protein [Verrucomicrobiae bacterium]